MLIIKKYFDLHNTLAEIGTRKSNAWLSTSHSYDGITGPAELEGHCAGSTTLKVRISAFTFKLKYNVGD